MRFRHVVLAVGYVIALPLFWLWDVPRGLRWNRLAARGWRERRTFDVAEIRGAHAWTRDMHSMASGLETITLLELELADGRRVVCEDFDGRVTRELAARGIHDVPVTHLGQGVMTLAWLAWLFFVLPILVLIAILYRS